MRLVGETGLGRGHRGRDITSQQPARRADPELTLVVAGCEPVRPAEGPVGRVPAASGRDSQVTGGQVLGRVPVVDKLADTRRDPCV